jgi:hypothetical protein
VVERLCLEWQRERVSLHERRANACSLQVAASELELFRLDVDADELNARELLAEDRQDSAYAATNLE